MTDDGRICRTCKRPVQLQNKAKVARLCRERGLSEREWPSDVPVQFLCAKHGLIDIYQVTFK